MVSVAAIHGWNVSIADVSTALLRGLTFEEIAKVTGEPLREVCFNPPKGSWKCLSAFQVMKGCSEVTRILALIKGGVRIEGRPESVEDQT